MFFNRSLENRVEKIKDNKEELNKLIEEYKPFIASTVQKKTGKYVEYGYDDELSIGMIAFTEAIKSYDKRKGKFLSFAKQVINLRLIDYYRKNEKNRKVIYLSNSKEDENLEINKIENDKALNNYLEKEINEIRKIEIIEYKNKLKSWNISFEELVKISPKQKKLRENYKDIAEIIVLNKDILNILLSSKRLPINKIQEKINIHRKKIERGRIYIIALVVAYTGDFEYIKDYIYRR